MGVLLLAIGIGYPGPTRSTRSSADASPAFAAGLARVSPLDVQDRILASFVDWVEVVAEFSFHPWQARLPADTHG